MSRGAAAAAAGVIQRFAQISQIRRGASDGVLGCISITNLVYHNGATARGVDEVNTERVLGYRFFWRAGIRGRFTVLLAVTGTDEHGYYYRKPDSKKTGNSPKQACVTTVA